MMFLSAREQINICSQHSIIYYNNGQVPLLPDVDFYANTFNYPIPNMYEYDSLYTPCEVMDAFHVKDIYIRSSLQTNIWYKDGTKDDVIAVIPIMTSFD